MVDVGIIRGLLGTRHTIASLGGELAGFAPALTVLSPPELRTELHRIGRTLVERYGEAGAVTIS